MPQAPHTLAPRASGPLPTSAGLIAGGILVCLAALVIALYTIHVRRETGPKPHRKPAISHPLPRCQPSAWTTTRTEKRKSILPLKRLTLGPSFRPWSLSTLVSPSLVDNEPLPLQIPSPYLPSPTLSLPIFATPRKDPIWGAQPLPPLPSQTVPPPPPLTRMAADVNPFPSAGDTRDAGPTYAGLPLPLLWTESNGRSDSARAPPSVDISHTVGTNRSRPITASQSDFSLSAYVASSDLENSGIAALSIRPEMPSSTTVPGNGIAIRPPPGSESESSLMSVFDFPLPPVPSNSTNLKSVKCLPGSSSNSLIGLGLDVVESRSHTEPLIIPDNSTCNWNSSDSVSRAPPRDLWTTSSDEYGTLQPSSTSLPLLEVRQLSSISLNILPRSSRSSRHPSCPIDPGSSPSDCTRSPPSRAELPSAITKNASEIEVESVPSSPSLKTALAERSSALRKLIDNSRANSSRRFMSRAHANHDHVKDTHAASPLPTNAALLAHRPQPSTSSSESADSLRAHWTLAREALTPRFSQLKAIFESAGFTEDDLAGASRSGHERSTIYGGSQSQESLRASGWFESDEDKVSNQD